MYPSNRKDPVGVLDIFSRFDIVIYKVHDQKLYSWDLKWKNYFIFYTAYDFCIGLYLELSVAYHGQRTLDWML